MFYKELLDVVTRIAYAAQESGQVNVALQVNEDDLKRVINEIVEAARKAGYQQAITVLEETSAKWTANPSPIGAPIGHLFHKAANVLRGPNDIVIQPDGTRSDNPIN